MLVQDLLEALLGALEDQTRSVVNSWFLAPFEDLVGS